MSYGHPCRRRTAGPLAGPASAYPTLRRPASICFNGPNEVFLVVPLASAGAPPPGFAKSDGWASRAAPTETPAMANKRRRDIPVDSACFMIFSPYEFCYFHSAQSRKLRRASSLEALPLLCERLTGFGKLSFRRR